MRQNLPPPPVQTPYDQNGVFSFPWIQWFQAVQAQINAGPVSIQSLAVYANDAAAKAAGLIAGNLYRSASNPSNVEVVT